MPSRWVLGILSTDYDLRDYRRAIIERLAETNVCVSAFEQPDFPVEPDQHSHENCVTALKRTNIAILIVDKRYGGIFYDSAKVSITMQEYLTAIERHIPCLVFVNKNTWDEAHAYKVDLMLFMMLVSIKEIHIRNFCAMSSVPRLIDILEAFGEKEQRRKENGLQITSLNNICIILVLMITYPWQSVSTRFIMCLD